MNPEGKNYFRHLSLVLIALVLALAAGHWGLPIYRHFKEKRSQVEAQEFFAKGDYRNALLSARVTLVLNSNNLPACRMMASLADAAHSPTTLDKWRRVVELSSTMDDKLALAAAGLRYQSPPYPLTTQTLDDLSPSADGLANFHVVSAELALALHHTTDAQNQFEAAVRLEPTNQLYQLNLAVISLAATNPATSAAARDKLKQFCNDTNLGPSALRSLVADRLVHNDAAGALAYSTQLLALAKPTLGDRLQHLGILKRLQNPELSVQLNSLQLEAATNAVMVAQLASWMMANDFLPQATEWLNQLPATIQKEPPVRLTLVDCYLAGENWRALRDFCAKGPWGEIEFLRLAFLSRAWGKLGEPVVATGNWNSAVNQAGNQFGALNALLELSARWGMAQEREDLLWRILRKFPDAGWAQHALEQIYFSSGDTKKLYQLYAERFNRAPQNVELKNNLAFTALLLKTNLNQTFQWAAEAYTAKTNDPTVVSTYAYALHLQHRDNDGLAALRQLDQAALQQPSIALYYGVLLNAAGKNDEAAPFLAIAKTKGQFLPEEKQLLTESAAK